MEKLSLIKIGGNIIDDAGALEKFIRDFAAYPGKKILVHGGGKLATAMSAKLGIETKMYEGRRITDADTLQVVTMVYAGWISKTITARLQANNCPAIGLCGADAALVKTVRRPNAPVDFGFVGDGTAEDVNTSVLRTLLDNGLVPVIAPVTADANGQLLNTNADTMAALIASALSPYYEVSLLFCFEKNGVLLDPENEASLIPALSKSEFESLKKNGIVSGGMVPKLSNAFEACESGVSEVHIMHASRLSRKGTDGGTKIYLS